jgi:DNA-binding NarL/FixJ family response regulator
MDQPIRVVVANQPRLMRELILGTIAEELNIDVVAEVQNEVEIVKVVDDTHPDFLIVSLNASSQRPAVCDILLKRYPELKILALAPERNSGMFYWASFDVHEIPVESSEAGILNLIRKTQVA